MLRLSYARSISGPFQRLALQSNELVSKGEYRLSIQLCLCEAFSPFTKEHAQIIDFKFLSDTTFCLATWFWKELRSTEHKEFNMCLGLRGKSDESVMFLRVIVSNYNNNFYQDVGVWNGSFYPCAGFGRIWPFALLGGRDSMVMNVFYFYICTFGSLYAVFCSSCMSCFPGMLLRYFLHDLEMVPLVPINTCLLLLSLSSSNFSLLSLSWETFTYPGVCNQQD